MNATASTLVAPDVHAARDFTRHLAELLRKEQSAMVSFLLALAECDGRRLWAAKEIAVAIAPMTAPPKREVLSAVQPKRLGVAPATSAPAQPVQALEPEHLPLRQAPVGTRRESVEDAAQANPRGGEVQPLTVDLRRLHVTVSKRWVEKLDAAKAALSHSIPSGSAEAVLEAALDALLEREAKRKGLLVKKPRGPNRTPANASSPAPATKRSAPAAALIPSTRTDRPRRDAIPTHVRREVLLRDGGRCQAKLHDGTLCGSTTRVQLDHVIPVALGGPPTMDNVRLLCDRHNRLAARAILGDAAMELFPCPRA